MEKAFSSPYVLAQRLGHELDAAELAGYDPEALVALFAQPPALHRFPKAMAARVQEVCQVLVERYDGDAALLWAEVADGPELLRRVSALPGFGKQKAQIFVALLGKRFGVTPQDWRKAAGGLRRPGRVPVGGRRHRRRFVASGAGVQAADEGGGQGEDRRRLTRPAGEAVCSGGGGVRQ